MFLSDVSIKRPVFTTMVTVGLMTLGLLATRNIGVDLFPDVSFPIVAVTTLYPGAGPQEVEQLVTKPIEEAVASASGVEEVRSYSRDSVSTVVIMFKLEADVKAAASDVREKIALIRAKLPRDVHDPLIQRVDPTAIPVLTYAVASNRSPGETRRWVEDTLKPRFEAVNGVASVKVSGGQEREIHVYFRARALEQLGLSMAQVSSQITSEGFDLPGGRVVEGAQELNVKTAARYRSLNELRGLVIATTQEGAQVHLSDVAEVVDGFKEVRSRNLLDGQEAVTLEIQKQGGSNTVAICDAVYRVIDGLKASGGLPPDVKLIKAVDASVFIRQNVADVTEAIVFGGAMAILVIFLFMLDWRSTLISALALPTSVVTTFLVMWWLGFTFNMMSLLAISLAIGLLIDDAVVVRENIFRHMERGEDPITAARKGTSEIGLAVMATTFTIVAVFVPVAFMGGLVGRMFRQFGLTVAAAVLVSLFISFTLDPMMSARVMKPIAHGHQERLRHTFLLGSILRAFEALDRYYRGLLEWALQRKKTVVFGALALFLGSLMLTPLMGKEFFAPQDRGEFRILLELPAGTSLAKTTEVTQAVEQRVRQHPEVRRFFTALAPNEEANKSSIRVYTSKKNERRATQMQIQEDLRQRLKGIEPGLLVTIADIQFIDGPAVEMPITLNVRGEDYAQLQRVATQALEVMKSVRGVKDADMSFRGGKKETSIVINRPAANDLGVSVGVLAQTVRFAVEGEVVAKFRDGERDHDVRIQLHPEDLPNAQALSQLTVPATGRRLGALVGSSPLAAMAAMGPRLVRLGEVATLTPTTGPATIERMNRQRQIILTANVADRSLGDAVADIEAKLATLEGTQGIEFVHGGATQRMQETFANMGMALLVAILFIYFVLASQFESFIHPLTIMLALPLAMVGAFLLLFLVNQPIGMPAMIGIILLMGLVTKNAILLVDYTHELRQRGLGLTQALLTAGPTRLRPILMTSAAMVLGMLPTAISTSEGSEFRAPMSVAVIGGVITSTFLTLLVVPVVYTWLDRFTSKSRQQAPLAEAPLAAADAHLVPAPAVRASAEEA
ncbi:MAG: efflux RND transporter permease subunit [Myxococcota bacterium]